MNLQRLFMTLVTLFLLLMLWGCSLFNPPTYKQDVRITRSAVNGKGEIKPSDLVSMPETWGNGSLYFHMREEFQPLVVGTDPTTGQLLVVNQEIMQSRDVEVIRMSDASVAGQVAIHQHAYAAQTADTITNAVQNAAVAAATGGAGAAPLMGSSSFINWMKGIAENAKANSTTGSAPAPPAEPAVPPAPTDEGVSEAASDDVPSDDVPSEL